MSTCIPSLASYPRPSHASLDLKLDFLHTCFAFQNSVTYPNISYTFLVGQRIRLYFMQMNEMCKRFSPIICDLQIFYMSEFLSCGGFNVSMHIDNLGIYTVQLGMRLFSIESIQSPSTGFNSEQLQMIRYIPGTDLECHLHHLMLLGSCHAVISIILLVHVP